MIKPSSSSIAFSRSRRLASVAGLWVLIVLGPGLGGCAHLMASLSGPGITDEDPGRRTVGMVVEDSSLQTKILGNLYKLDARFQQAGIDVVSFNGVVLMAGNVRDESMIGIADRVARAMRNVRKVHNELRVGPESSSTARTNDAWIASKIRFFMSVTRDFPASRIKVTVNDGTVYLMGLVSESEAADSIMVIRNVSGIKRIVKVYEYIADDARTGPAAPSSGTRLPSGNAPMTGEPASWPSEAAGHDYPAASEAVDQDADFHTLPAE